MIKLSWTVPVDDPEAQGSPRINRHELWKALLGKAENPLEYVPSITECRILERYADGFLREIIRNGNRLVQRVTPEPENRILFSHVGDPEVASIANLIDADEQGRLTFTIEVTLAPGGERQSLEQSDFLRAINEYFTSTIEAIIGALRPLVAVSTETGSDNNDVHPKGYRDE